MLAPVLLVPALSQGRFLSTASRLLVEVVGRATVCLFKLGTRIGLLTTRFCILVTLLLLTALLREDTGIEPLLLAASELSRPRRRVAGILSGGGTQLYLLA